MERFRLGQEIIIQYVECIGIVCRRFAAPLKSEQELPKLRV